MNHTTKAWNAPALEYLTEENMRELHGASLDILENPGTAIHHEEALALLKTAGALVEKNHLVRLPPALVEKALKSAPSRVTVYDRENRPAMALEDRHVYFGTGSDCPHLLDGSNGERRPFLLRDVTDAVTLVDALPHLDFCMSMGLGNDLDKKIQYQSKYAVMLRHSTKPQVITAGDRDCLDDMTEMAAAVRGGRDELIKKPLFILYDEPTSPLVHTFEAVDKLLYMAENRLPVNYSPGIMAGATSPVTMAGAIVQANAEILAGLVVHQVRNPGAPFVFGAGMSPMDMSSMQPTYSAPEAMMTQAGLCQIGRCLYNLPTWGFGGCTASKTADEQAVNEASNYLLMCAWMGTNLVHDVGYLEFGLTYSFELLVMCDEFIGQIRRMMSGISLDREHLAVEVIRRVGIAGHFLGDDHTFRHFRENWQPGITDRRTYDKWKADGGTTLNQRARARVVDILETHRPKPLDEGSLDKIARILEKAGSRA